MYPFDPRFIFTNFMPDRNPNRLNNRKIISTSHLEQQISQKTMTPKNFTRAKITRRDFIAREVPKARNHPEFEPARLPVGISRAYSLQRDSFRPLVSRFPLAPLPGFMAIYTNLCASTGTRRIPLARWWRAHEEPSEPTRRSCRFDQRSIIVKSVSLLFALPALGTGSSPICTYESDSRYPSFL